MRASVALLSALVLAAPTARAADTVSTPADKARTSDTAPEPGSEPLGNAVVRGERFPSSDTPVGATGQPQWTARRHFPNTRVYVFPEGTAQFEVWVATKHPFDDLGNSRFRTQYELAFGLGHRLQLDLYVETEQQASPWILAREKFELRYAFADWGKLPGNPALYLELVHEHDGPAKGEVKLLLGGAVRPRLYWGANLVYERELSGAVQEQEYAVTGALSWAAVDGRLGVGAELKVETTDTRTTRFQFEAVEVLLGPSIVWRIHPKAQLSLTALLGAEVSSTGAKWLLEPTLIFGWTF
jgi:hypothetical protein